MDNYVDFLNQYKQRKSVDYYDVVSIIYAADVHYYNNHLNYYRAPPLVSDPVIYAPPTIYTIDVSVNSIADLISIVDKTPFVTNTIYNINLAALHRIRGELVELNNMIGMSGLKRSVLNQLIYYIQGLHKSDDFKHTILCGPPGTGKTEVAKIIGRMYAKAGILRKNVFKKVTRTDLVAGYLGQTAIKTRKVIDECIGGCLFIDEAYSLGDDDIYSKECIDTLCEALSDHKDDLMVIVAGYNDELNRTLFRVNRGLKSRFIWKFNIDDYSALEIMRIFEKKVLDAGWTADCLTEQWFEKRVSSFKHFGRDVELLFSHVKICHSNRIFGKDASLRKQITIGDLENGFRVFLENSKEKVDTSKLSYFL
jgi:hypothetical protein